jgi:hypothetical protein
MVSGGSEVHQGGLLNLLRYVLVAATLSGLGWFLYIGATDRGDIHSPELAVMIGFALNLIYLLRCPPGISKSPSRLRKLASLWLDAKERELRDRAGKP